MRVNAIADSQESPLVANSFSQKQAVSKSTFQLIDNRPEFLQAREVQAMADNSLQLRQATQLQAMADDYAAQPRSIIPKERIPHEVRHVEQQPERQVKLTKQMPKSGGGLDTWVKGGEAINDDLKLEKKADEIGVKAVQCPSVSLHSGKLPNPIGKQRATQFLPGVYQLVRGGIEYTEDAPTNLYWRPRRSENTGPNPQKQATILGSSISLFAVENEELDSLLGESSNAEHILLKRGNIKLINDEHSAEWVIEHHETEASAGDIVDNFKRDIEVLYTMRDQLANEVENLPRQTGKTVILTADHRFAFGDELPPEGWFIYRPGPSKGKVQITFQYGKTGTIKNIARINVSKFLSGEKLEKSKNYKTARYGKPVMENPQNLFSRLFRGSRPTAWKHSGLLLQELSQASKSISYGWGNALRPETIGLVKLMVLNDALATTMSRFDRGNESNDHITGDAQEKNMQQFFPKSERQHYVRTVQQAMIPRNTMIELRQQIINSAQDSAAGFWRLADPLALETSQAFSELGPEESLPHITTRLRLQRGDLPDKEQIDALKNLILGENGQILATWISRAAAAYTDTSGTVENHQFEVGYGSVIRSDQGYTPIKDLRGAVYERREPEIPMAPGRIDKVLEAIRYLAFST